MKLLGICKVLLFVTYYGEMLAKKIFLQSHNLSMDLTGIQRGLLVSDQFITITANVKSPKEFIIIIIFFLAILPSCNMSENIFIQM